MSGQQIMTHTTEAIWRAEIYIYHTILFNMDTEQLSSYSLVEGS